MNGCRLALPQQVFDPGREREVFSRVRTVGCQKNAALRGFASVEAGAGIRRPLPDRPP